MALNNEHETQNDKSSETKKNKGCLIAILGVIGFFILSYVSKQFEGGNIVSLWIFAVAIIVFGIYLFYKSIQMNRERINKQSELNDKYNATISGSIQHIEGLSLPKGVFIKLYYGNNKITFVKDHQEISLNLSKVIGMDIVKGNDIQAQATGAIAGKLILGGLSGVALGALISSKFYFVISYKSDNENKSIILDDSGGELSGDKLNIFKLINDFKLNHNDMETEKTEL